LCDNLPDLLFFWEGWQVPGFAGPALFFISPRVPVPSGILLISHIPEMQGEFANTLVVGMGTDNASRIREVE